jgi:hypothetical protein
MNLTLAGDVTKVRVARLQEAPETHSCSQEKIAAVEFVHRGW